MPPSVFSRMNETRAAHLRRTILELSARGLSARAIAVVLDLYEGVEINHWTISYWMQKWGGAPSAGGRGQRARLK